MQNPDETDSIFQNDYNLSRQVSHLLKGNLPLADE